MLCLRESLNGAFLFPFKDDDHFSPEADAAMSEMTGNTALLAQVCVRGRQAGQGLSDEPPAGFCAMPPTASVIKDFGFFDL